MKLLLLRIILSVTEAIASYDTWNGNGRRRVKQSGYSRHKKKWKFDRVATYKNIILHILLISTALHGRTVNCEHRVSANETALPLARSLARSHSLKVSIYTTICLISFRWRNAPLMCDPRLRCVTEISRTEKTRNKTEYESMQRCLAAEVSEDWSRIASCIVDTRYGQFWSFSP